MSRYWMIGGAAFLAVLLAAGGVAALLESDAAFPEGSAEAAVQRYVKAVEEGDWETAHSLLTTELREECPVEELARARSGRDRGDRRITLEESRTLGESLLVTVSITESRFSGPFGVDQWSYEETYSLTEEGGEWRFSEYPHPLYGCRESELPPPAPTSPGGEEETRWT